MAPKFRFSAELRKHFYILHLVASDDDPPPPRSTPQANIKVREPIGDALIPFTRTRTATAFLNMGTGAGTRKMPQKKIIL